MVGGGEYAPFHSLKLWPGIGQPVADLGFEDLADEPGLIS